MTKFTDLPMDVQRIIYDYEGNYKYRNGEFIPQIPLGRKIPIFYVPVPKVFNIGVGKLWKMCITLRDYNGYDNYSIILVKQNFTHPCICINKSRIIEEIYSYFYKKQGMGIPKKSIIYNDTTLRHV
jgi:hypothetical protein